jgi:hypothetical protein
MKKFHFHFIILCFCFISLSIGCERTELQKSANDDKKLTTRTIECTDCPEADCCCGVEVLSSGGAYSLALCGTSSPDNTTTTCGGTIQGCSFSGFILNFALSYLDTGLFCMPTSHAFSIVSSSNVTVRISCQAGSIGPQSIDVTLAANTPKAIGVNGSCEVAECSH